MSSVVRAGSLVMAVAILLRFVSQANADVERSQALLSSMPVQGVTLSMTPRQAFETLVGHGYTAGNIKSFDEWRSGGIQMVRGSSEDPRGESYMTLGRIPGQLINISETTNKRHGERINYEAEIAAVKQHFGINEDEGTCTTNTDKGAGICFVSDGNKQKLFAYLIEVRSISRNVQLGYVFEPTVGLDDKKEGQ